MTVDEAIEIKSREGEEFLHTDPDEIDEAERLSIEALKHLQQERLLHTYPAYKLLPGETKAVDQRLANIGYGSSEALKRQGG